jgi:hypothetical protein
MPRLGLLELSVGFVIPTLLTYLRATEFQLCSPGLERLRRAITVLSEELGRILA